MKLRKIAVTLEIETDKSIVELRRAKFYAFGVTPVGLKTASKELGAIDTGAITQIQVMKIQP